MSKNTMNKRKEGKGRVFGRSREMRINQEKTGNGVYYPADEGKRNTGWEKNSR